MKKNKYEITLFNRNNTDHELIDDLLTVAKKLQTDKLSTTEYNRYGKFHSSTIQNRFNGWNKALLKAGLNVKKHNKINEACLIDDLKDVAKLLDKKSITRDEYLTHGNFSITPFIREFGSWFKALSKAGLNKTRNYKVTNQEYFENLENIWLKLGRQPKYKEIQKPFSKYCAGAYERRFGNFSNALKEFVAYINSDENGMTEGSFISEVEQKSSKNDIIKHKTDRNINWRLRFKILNRDNFKCIKCGRSPATDSKVELHVDHKIPWSKGGETLPDNLQTLCKECNIGKSDFVL